MSLRTCAEDVAADLLRRDQVLGMRVGNVTLEVRVANHLRELGASLRVTKERLREEEDKLDTRRLVPLWRGCYSKIKTNRLAEVAVNLTTKDVELERTVVRIDTDYHLSVRT